MTGVRDEYDDFGMTQLPMAQLRGVELVPPRTGAPSSPHSGASQMDGGAWAEPRAEPRSQSSANDEAGEHREVSEGASEVSERPAEPLSEEQETLVNAAETQANQVKAVEAEGAAEAAEMRVSVNHDDATHKDPGSRCDQKHWEEANPEKSAARPPPLFGLEPLRVMAYMDDGDGRFGKGGGAGGSEVVVSGGMSVFGLGHGERLVQGTLVAAAARDRAREDRAPDVQFGTKRESKEEGSSFLERHRKAPRFGGGNQFA